MHFYAFYIGEYAAHTQFITLHQDLAYRRLLDLYYMSEKPLPQDPARVAKMIGMTEYQDDVLEVLNEFFAQSGEGWTNKRADIEIERIREKTSQAKRAAQARWRSASKAPKSGSGAF